MGNVAGARQSPRIVAGELQFYEGDTFALELDISLLDMDGTKVELVDGDEIFFRVTDRSDGKIFEELLQAGDRMQIRFDQATVADMPKGRYYATVQLRHAGEIGTAACRVPILVL